MQSIAGVQACAVFTDRRRAERYLLRCSLSYLALNRVGPKIAGSGEVLNISSSGVLFLSDRLLPARARVKLSIHWPVALHGVKALDLIIHGTVVRSEGNHLVAIRREKYDFVVRPKMPTAASQSKT
jgi:hypothetical protein